MEDWEFLAHLIHESDMLLLSKVRNLMIFGSGPVRSWADPSLIGSDRSHGGSTLLGGDPSLEQTGLLLKADPLLANHSLDNWIKMRGPLDPSFQSHVICLSQSEGPLTCIGGLLLGGDRSAPVSGPLDPSSQSHVNCWGGPLLDPSRERTPGPLISKSYDLLGGLLLDPSRERTGPFSGADPRTPHLKERTPYACDSKSDR